MNMKSPKAESRKVEFHLSTGTGSDYGGGAAPNKGLQPRVIAPRWIGE
jgi:hypothetical protein